MNFLSEQANESERGREGDLVEVLRGNAGEIETTGKSKEEKERRDPEKRRQRSRDLHRDLAVRASVRGV
ncbi:hypothetical protein ACLOJK_028193 [Asimina triloba]